MKCDLPDVLDVAIFFGTEIIKPMITIVEKDKTIYTLIELDERSDIIFYGRCKHEIKIKEFTIDYIRS